MLMDEIIFRNILQKNNKIFNFLTNFYIFHKNGVKTFSEMVC